VHDQNLKRVETGHGSGSCGCERKEKLSQQKYATTHGRSGTREYKMWKAASERAKKLGLPFNLELDDVIVPEVCPLLGTKLTYGTKQPTWDSPSLDKLIPEK